MRYIPVHIVHERGKGETEVVTWGGSFSGGA
jgi:hypothetical protein